MQISSKYGIFHKKYIYKISIEGGGNKLPMSGIAKFT